jgi:hypothetical protein
MWELEQCLADVVLDLYIFIYFVLAFVLLLGPFVFKVTNPSICLS